MKAFVRSILITGTLAIFANSSMVAQTGNGWFEHWYRAKYGRPSPTEEARLKTQQANAASQEATPALVTANGGFEQWYRAKYGRPSPSEEARLTIRPVNAVSPEGTLPAVAVSASVGQMSPGHTPAMEHLGKRQLNKLIAAAKTPAEHQRIAKFYQSQAQDYLAQSKEHAQEAEQARNNPMRNNNKSAFSTVNHCEHFARKFSDLAAKSQELAKQHEQMASE
ncbi:MAG TPA: hypothetical protein VF865_02705 [Acidobacteriaceae bacterium]